jgi:hypothetical protein
MEHFINANMMNHLNSERKCGSEFLELGTLGMHIPLQTKNKQQFLSKKKCSEH